MTSIDTIYEFAGLKLAGALWGIFSGVGLPVIVALGGMAYAVHQMIARGSIRDLGVHFFYLILAFWLVSAGTYQGVKTPRYVAYVNQAADVLQKRAVAHVQERFLTEPYEWERIAAMVGSARILDARLGGDLARFLEGCAKPALARGAPAHANLLRDGALSYREECEDRRKDLWRRLQEHVQKDSRHASVLEAARKRDPGQGSEFAARYADEIALRAIDEPGSPTSESSLVLASLGEYSYTDRAQHTGAVPWWARLAMGFAGAFYGDEIANVAITGFAELQQNWDGRFGAKQKLYLATIYGPHLYGLSLMLVAGLFPVAGLFALLPGKWTVFVNFGKVLMSIKLWPVGWAALTSFNARRGALEVFDPVQRGTGEVFLALSALYLLIPALAFLVVHLAAAAAAMPFAPAVPPPSGPGLGPAGPVVQVAARLAR